MISEYHVLRGSLEVKHLGERVTCQAQQHHCLLPDPLHPPFTHFSASLPPKTVTRQTQPMIRSNKDRRRAEMTMQLVFLVWSSRSFHLSSSLKCMEADKCD